MLEKSWLATKFGYEAQKYLDPVETWLENDNNTHLLVTVLLEVFDN